VVAKEHAVEDAPGERDMAGRRGMPLGMEVHGLRTDDGRDPTVGAVVLERRPRVEPDDVCRPAAGQEVGLPDEPRDEFGLGIPVDLARASGLHDAAALHDDDDVGEAHGLFLVVRDEHEGAAERAMQPAKLLLHGAAELQVESGERLIEEEHLRPHHEGPGERDALRLSAGKLGRRPVGKVLKVDEGQHLGDADGNLGLRYPGDPEPIGNVLPHGHMREEPIALEDHVGGPALRPQMRDVLPGDLDPAAARIEKAADHLEERGLAAARGAEDRQEVTLADDEIRGLDRDLVAKAPGHPDEPDERLAGDRRHRSSRARSGRSS
jgi:hypothetical protein